MIRYVAKPDTWFDAGTECELLVDCRPQAPFGVFRGLRTSNSSTSLRTTGEKYIDEETCNFNEFEVVGDNF